MELLQTAYIKLLRPFENINNRSNRKLRYCIILLCFVVLFFNIIIQYSKTSLFSNDNALDSILLMIKSNNDNIIAVIGLIIMLIVTICSVESRLHIIKWKWYILVVWVVCSMLIIIAGIFHDIGEGLIISQLSILLIFPCFYFVWQNNGEIERIFDLISWAFTITILIYGIVCMTFYPYGTNTISNIQYMGSTSNPNLLAFFSAGGIITSLYLISRNKTRIAIINMLSLTVSLVMLVLTISRGSFLAVSVSALAFLILYLRMKKNILKLVVMLLVVAVTFAPIYFNVTRGNDPAKLFSKVTTIESAYAEDKSDNTYESKSEIALRIENFKNLNQFTTGRVGIWQIYFKYLNFTGNDVSYALPIRVVEYYGGTHTYYHVHNTAYEMAFRCGLPTGILYLIIEIMALLYAARHFFRRRKKLKEYDIFVIMAIITFFIVGSVESIEVLFQREITLIFYLSLIPLFAKDDIADDIEAGDIDA